jgi:ATP-dependent phosphoenolpyruvate carboxykinase
VPAFCTSPGTLEEYRRHVLELTLLVAPGFQGFPPVDGTNAGTIIALNFAQQLCLIGNTEVLLPLSEIYDGVTFAAT